MGREERQTPARASCRPPALVPADIPCMSLFCCPTPPPPHPQSCTQSSAPCAQRSEGHCALRPAVFPHAAPFRIPPPLCSPVPSARLFLCPRSPQVPHALVGAIDSTSLLWHHVNPAASKQAGANQLRWRRRLQNSCCDPTSLYGQRVCSHNERPEVVWGASQPIGQTRREGCAAASRLRQQGSEQGANGVNRERQGMSRGQRERLGRSRGRERAPPEGGGPAPARAAAARAARRAQQAERAERAGRRGQRLWCAVPGAAPPAAPPAPAAGLAVRQRLLSLLDRLLLDVQHHRHLHLLRQPRLAAARHRQSSALSVRACPHPKATAHAPAAKPRLPPSRFGLPSRNAPSPFDRRLAPQTGVARARMRSPSLQASPTPHPERAQLASRPPTHAASWSCITYTRRSRPPRPRQHPARCSAGVCGTHLHGEVVVRVEALAQLLLEKGLLLGRVLLRTKEEAHRGLAAVGAGSRAPSEGRSVAQRSRASERRVRPQSCAPWRRAPRGVRRPPACLHPPRPAPLRPSACCARRAAPTCLLASQSRNSASWRSRSRTNSLSACGDNRGARRRV